MSAAGRKLDSQIADIRRFNRFYTREVGILRESFLDAGLTLPEVRVLYEIAHGKQVTATEIGGRLRMDAGYLSRLLQKLQRRRFLVKERAEGDGRQSYLKLTRSGEKQFELQNRRQNEEVEKLLAKLPVEEQQRLVSAMKTIQRVAGWGRREAGEEGIRIASATTGRHGMDRIPAWRDLRAGSRLG